MFKIECRCDGVYTGYRIAYLKVKGSKEEAVFATLEEAKRALPKSQTLLTGTRLEYRIVEV